MRYLAAIILFLAVVFVGCSNTEQIPSRYSETEKEYETVIPKTEDCSGFVLVDETHQNSICVTWQNYIKPKTEEKEFLKKFVEDWLEEYTDESFSLTVGEKRENTADLKGYYIELEGETTFRSDEFVSVVFQGMINAQNSAHPNHVFFSVNYDPVTQKEISFASRYVSDEALYSAFVAEGEKLLSDEFGGNLTEPFSAVSGICSAEQFELALREDCPEYRRIYYYETSQSVGFSYSVVFALGGHKEVELPRSQLKPC